MSGTELSDLDRHYEMIDSIRFYQHKSQGIVAKIHSDRKRDPLLAYLVQARNTREHRPFDLIQRTGSRVFWNVSLDLLDKAGPRGVILGEDIEINFDLPNPIVSAGYTNPQTELISEPATLQLIPMPTRQGNILMPPLAHLGRTLLNHSPIHISNLGFNYYKSGLKKLKSLINK